MEFPKTVHLPIARSGGEGRGGHKALRDGAGGATAPPASTLPKDAALFQVTQDRAVCRVQAPLAPRFPGFTRRIPESKSHSRQIHRIKVGEKVKMRQCGKLATLRPTWDYPRMNMMFLDLG